MAMITGGDPFATSSTSLQPCSGYTSFIALPTVNGISSNIVELALPAGIKLDFASYNPAVGSSNGLLNENAGEVEAVRMHKLMPAIKVLLQLCEQAMNTLSLEMGDFNDVAVCDTLVKIKDAAKNNDALKPDSCLDDLMELAVVVLRIHLLELQKVRELCDDFCVRYIDTLKQKLGIDLVNELTSGDSDGEDSPELEPLHYDFAQSPLPPWSASTNNSVPGSSQAGLWHDNFFIDGNKAPQSSGQNSAVLADQLTQNATAQEVNLSGDWNNRDEKLSDRQKRGTLPRSATAVLRTWLFQHLAHPYPTETEKQELATQAALSLMQVNNWFINARRRVLLPVMRGNDGYAIDSVKPKRQKDGADSRKRKKPQAQKDWSQQVAPLLPTDQGVDQHTAHAGYFHAGSGLHCET